MLKKIVKIGSDFVCMLVNSFTHPINVQKFQVFRAFLVQGLEPFDFLGLGSGSRSNNIIFKVLVPVSVFQKI